MDPLDPKNPSIVHGRCVIVIRESRRSKGSYVVRCLTKSQRGLSDLIFDDEIEDMIRALKKASNSIYWRKFRRIILG